MSLAEYDAPYCEFAIDDRSAAAKPPVNQVTLEEISRSASRNLDGNADDFVEGLYQSMIGSSDSTRRQGGALSGQAQIEKYRGWIASCIERLADGVSQVVLRTLRTKPDGSDPDEIIDPKHPVVKLFEKPNPLDTKIDFWQRTIQYLECTGKAVWLKVRQGGAIKRGPVVELWPLPVQYMRPVYENGNLYGYAITGGSVGEVIIPPEDCVVHQIPDPSNRFWPRSRIDRMIDYVRANDAVLASQLTAFNNDILATLAFVTKDKLSDPNWKRLMGVLLSRYAGFTKAGKPLLLEAGLEVKQLRPNPKEMEYQASADFLRAALTAAFCVPPIILGITEGANYSNTASQEHIFEKYAIKPRCEKIDQRINMDLIEPDFNDPTIYVKFDDPVSEDQMQMRRLESIDLTNGVRTINEVRQERGLADVFWGNVPRWVYELEFRGSLVDPNADPSSGGDVNVDPQNDNANGREPNGNDRPNDQLSADESRRRRFDVRAKGSSFNRKIGRRPRPRDDEQVRALLRSVGKATAREYERLKGDCIPVLRRYFGRQKDRIIENVTKIFGSRLDEASRSIVEVPKKIFCVTANGELHARLFVDGTTVDEIGSHGVARLGAFVCPKLACGGMRNGEFSQVVLRKLDGTDEDELDDWQKAAEALADALVPKIKAAMSAGGDVQLDYLDLKSAFDLDSPKAREWLLLKDRDYWNKTVNATTKQLLSEKLSAVMQDAPTIEKLTDVVSEVMEGRINSSAETIARTEVVGAYNAGSSIVRKEAGVDTKQWVATNDDRTRDAHLDADGQTVSESAKFLVDGEELEYPGDPHGSVSNIVNCRCSAIAIID